MILITGLWTFYRCISIYGDRIDCECCCCSTIQRYYEEYEASDGKIRWHACDKPGEKHFYVTVHSANAEGVCAVVERKKRKMIFNSYLLFRSISTVIFLNHLTF